MTRIRVAVTAEDIAAARSMPRFVAWGSPVEAAIHRLTGQSVDVDAGGPPKGHCIATIGQDDWTVVVDLPPDADAWLGARWETGDEGPAFAFYLEIPAWLEDLIRLGAAR